LKSVVWFRDSKPPISVQRQLQSWWIAYGRIHLTALQRCYLKALASGDGENRNLSPY